MTGSSPPTRGARIKESSSRVPFRIIPAYAGSTHHLVRQAHHHPDHPRLRGEHSDPVRDGDITGGSSPPTRGARRRASSQSRFLRIIPAYAGSTLALTARTDVLADHPRLRGEHPFSSA